ERLAVDRERAADHAAIAAEALLPLAVAEHRNEPLARMAILVGRKSAPEDRLGPEHAEIVAGDDLAEHLLWITIADRHVQGNPGVRRQAGKHLVLVADVAVVHRRHLQKP